MTAPRMTAPQSFESFTEGEPDLSDYPQLRTPRRMTARRGAGFLSTQTRSGTHRGERANTLPDQNVTG
jgi:hypothetical protein